MKSAEMVTFETLLIRAYITVQPSAYHAPVQLCVFTISVHKQM